jgi:L-aminopeptidase/D-esterase-like protein
LIADFHIGHYTDLENITGCTVVLAPPQGAVGGVDVRGPAPGTRETEVLGTGRLIERIHAVVLAGGSAFGLDTASGVVEYLEAQNIGYDVGIARVPIVSAAVLFDLAIGNARVRPNAANAYHACLIARNDAVAEGSVGAGTGATIGKLLDMEHATKGGIGYSERVLKNGIAVGALVAVNALGDVVDCSTGQIVGGARNADGTWADSSQLLLTDDRAREFLMQNTTLGVVLTDAALTVEQANLIARMAHDGVARATRPSHTLFDGDTLFVLASGTRGAGDLTTLGHAAAECVADAIVRGVKLARGLGGVKAWNES